MKAINNGYLVFTSFNDSKIKIALFNWYGNTDDRSLESLELMMLQKCKCTPYIFIEETNKFDSFMSDLSRRKKAFIAFEVEDGMVGNATY